MSSFSFFGRCLGLKESSQSPVNEPRTVAKAEAPIATEHQPRECINCTRRAFKGALDCEACGRPLRQQVVDPGLLAAANKHMQEGDKTQKKTTGDGVLLAYNDRCRLHRDEKATGSFIGRDHPERPDRAAAVMARLQAAGLVERCLRTEGREATLPELLTVHDKGLIAAIERSTKLAERVIQQAQCSWYGPEAAALERLQLSEGEYIQDVYFNASTAACARLAAGSAAEVARRVVTGAARHGAAIIRPPGHHAESSVAMGFCYYNNAAVAARAAQAAGARRVVIMDWDVHHGNGTQKIFYEDPTVLYMSTHRYDSGCFYPGSGDSNETGSGPGTGFTVNVPWNTPGVRDADMLAAFRHVVVPVAAEFRPDLVIVSAGFDAVEGDPLGGCRVSPAAFSHFMAQLASLAPTVVLLEGGYNLTATAEATEGCLRVLLGEGTTPLADSVPKAALTRCKSTVETDPWVMSGLEGVSDTAMVSIFNTLKEHSGFWQAAARQRVLVEAALERRLHEKQRTRERERLELAQLGERLEQEAEQEGAENKEVVVAAAEEVLAAAQP